MYKYVEIKNKIIEYLKELKYDELLPTYVTLAKKYAVSDITVRKAMNELLKEGYVYSVHRVGVYKSKPKRVFKDVAVVTDAIYGKYINDDSLFPWIITDIEQNLRKNDLNMLLSCFGDDFDFEKNILENILERNPYGVIVNASGEKSNFEFYEKVARKIQNFVFLDRYIEGINGHFVGSNSYDTAYRLVNHLKGKFDCIYIPVAYYQRALSSEIDRISGFTAALENRGYNYELIKMVSLNPQTSFEEIMVPKFKELFATRSVKSIGFVCVNSETISKFVKYFEEDIKKLDKISIVSFDALYCNLPSNLSGAWAKQNSELIAEQTINIIKNNPEKKQKILIPCEIKSF